MPSFKLGRWSPRRVLGSVKKAASSAVRGTRKKVVSAARSTRRIVSRPARSIIKRAPVRRARQAVSRTRAAVRQVRQTVRTKTRQGVRKVVRKTRGAAGRVARTTSKARTKVGTTARRAAERVVKHPATRAIGHAGAVHGLGQSVKRLGGDGLKAGRDIRRALRTRSLSDAGRAVRSTARALGSVGNVVAQAPAARDAVRAGQRTLRRKMPATVARLSGVASRALNRSGLRRGAGALRRKAGAVVRHPTTRVLRGGLSTGRRLGGHSRRLLGFGTRGAFLPGQALTASKDIRHALRTRGEKAVDKALGSTRDVLVSARDLVTDAPLARRSARVLGRVARRKAPKVSERVNRQAQQLARSSGARSVSRAARQVGSTAAVKAGARVGGKALGRFVPGANVAIAGVDTAAFVNTLRDEKASTGKKVLAGVRATGSIVGATNVPVVSQVGAAISTGADLASAIKPPKVDLPKLPF
ncbi:hypothetical protein JRI60_51710 [Archangium violaceum]|uniref:hypothetical protein n=1 Tax=Archangium violaceum TaxID=83451 RepID=UPI0019527894|nr:hypothetical protein [Archangium violaceum]QRN97322.1 hypothetical protein JRI60_51710 [Archangium violaceum]